MKTVVIGTRGSQLALAQSNYIIDELKKFNPAINWELKVIQTTGDKFLKETFAKLEGKGLFVKEIESALLMKEIDLAVHSMKDLPSEEDEALKIAAITERENPRDVLVSCKGYYLSSLPRGAAVGTSSVRRKAQLLNVRPDLQFNPIRGNVNTRLRKMKELELDAVILAYAGLKRLDLLREVGELISTEICTPAVGQGALGVQIRSGDKEIESIVSLLNHDATNKAITAERCMLKYLGGGCSVPMGGYAEIEGSQIKLRGMVSSPDGRLCLKDFQTGPVSHADLVGHQLAQRLLEKGAKELINMEMDE